MYPLYFKTIIIIISGKRGWGYVVIISDDFFNEFLTIKGGIKITWKLVKAPLWVIKIFEFKDLNVNSDCWNG